MRRSRCRSTATRKRSKGSWAPRSTRRTSGRPPRLASKPLNPDAVGGAFGCPRRCPNLGHLRAFSVRYQTAAPQLTA
jgi:hypothetical protein